jgi:hypothetical protein
MDFDFATATPVTEEGTTQTPVMDFDFASARPASKLDQVAFNVMDNNSFAMEKAKDLISGVEALPSVVGKAVYLTGESMKIYANKETRDVSPVLPFQRPKNILENSPVAKAYDKMIGQFGSQLSVIGKTFSDHFENAANKGFESPNPAVMAGWKYPIRKVSSLAVRGLPMLGAAAIVTAKTGNPLIGASMFGPIAAEDYYSDAIAHGLPPEQAMGGAMALGTSQTLLESIPMANWMKGGSIAKRVFSTAISEGLVEEGSQQLIDNGLRVLGWDDGRPVYDRMVDGLAESVLAGTLMGGTLGMFQAPGVEEVRKDVEDFVIKEGFKKGLTDEQIVKSVEVAHNAIETAITAPKQEVVAEPTKEVATAETKVSEPLSPLHAEALKYKTAEEFVASKGKTFYHATSTKNLQSIENVGLNKGMITDTFSDAQEYAQMLKNRTGEDVSIIDVYPKKEQISSKGVVETVSGKRIGERFDVVSPIKTKAQLTAIWNEAQATQPTQATPTTPVAEVKKYVNPKTISGLIKQYGGIDISKVSKDYNIKNLKENAGDYIFKNSKNEPGIFTFDEIAQELASAGQIQIPEGSDPGDYLYELVSSREKTQDVNEDIGFKAGEEDAKNNPLIRKVRGLSRSIAVRAIEQDLDLTMQDLPDYDVKKNPGQAAWAQSIVEND